MDFVDSAFKHSELTGKIIGAAIQVHNYHGNGFPEHIYQNSLEVELTSLSINFEREKSIKIFYHDVEVGKRRVDFHVEKIISVELKAVSKLEPIHFAQAINYLEAFNIETGLLINFGAKRLEWKRLINTPNNR